MSEPVPQAPPLLELAPPKKSGDRFWAVLLFGLLSTAIALGLVFLLSHFAQENLMGWYLDEILPVGAILVGLVASSGYGLSVWRTGLKIRGRLLLLIVLFQIVSYFGAQYMEFLIKGPFIDAAGRTLGFTEYFHLSTTLMSWKESSDKPSAPLGGIGYLVRAGEILGFSLGTLLVPLALMKAPYCELCELYMKRLELAAIPASGMEATGDRASPLTAQEAFEAGIAEMKHFTQAASEGDLPTFLQKLELQRSRLTQHRRRTRYFGMSLVYCKICKQAYIDFKLVENAGRKTSSTPAGRQEVTAAFTSQILASPVLKVSSKVY